MTEKAASSDNPTGNMKFLLIDNSNTRTKFRLADAQQLLPEQEWLPTCDLTVDAVENLTASWEFDAVLLCSVVPQKAAILHTALAACRPFHQDRCRDRMPLSFS